MNTLLLRFAFFLSMATGIAAVAVGEPRTEALAQAPAENVCALDGIARLAGAIERREPHVVAAPRPVRWQTLLPGAFR